MGYNVAIDGPAGAGKSTIAKKIAKKMNYIYVDTGAMYRAMALFLLRNHIEPTDEKAVSEKCREADITIRYEQGEQVVLLNGENVNGLIRTEEVGNMASYSSPNPDVRKKNGGAAEAACEDFGCHHGRQGYRHLRASGRGRQDLSDGKQRGAGKETL